jgi:AcrR family transcriptional regulator
VTANSDQRRALPLRERSRLRTRQDLLDAGVELFRVQGYASTTITAIAAAAGMSRRSFFRYFRSKQDLALALDEEQWEIFITTFTTGPASESPLDDLRASLLETFATLTPESQAMPRVIEIRALVAANPEVRAAYLLRDAQWADRVTDALAARLGVDPERDYRPRLWAELLQTAKDVALDIVARSHLADRAVPAESVLRDVLVAANLMEASDAPAQPASRVSSEKQVLPGLPRRPAGRRRARTG